MKYYIRLFLVVAIFISLQSCRRWTKDVHDAGDSIKLSKDTIADLDTEITTLNSVDAKFATAAAIADIAEIALARLALSKSKNVQITAFTKSIINENRKARVTLVSISINKNFSLPTALDIYHQVPLEELNKLREKGFDFAFIKAMVDNYKQTLYLMETEAKIGADADLRSFAENKALTVKMRLNLVNQIQDNVY